MSIETLSMTSELLAYLRKNSLREPKVLADLRKETLKTECPQMQISPEQGQFMRLLIEILGAKKTLDIGTFTGYSALSVALSLPNDGKVIACDTSVEFTNIAKQFWQEAGVGHKIELKIGPALETLNALIAAGENGTFDFSFIDADKHNYANYYEKSLTLLRPGGIIAIDNVLWSGKVADMSIKEGNTVAIREFNTMVLNDKRVNMSLVPIGDGLTLARKL